jgi:multidrug efflux pump subunit AcrA (membrane-fusion protein)
MSKRQLSIIGAIVFLVLSFIIARSLGKKELYQRAEEPARKTRLVNTLTVFNSDVAAFIPVTGRIMARNRIEIFAEVSGIYETGHQPFKEGNRFPSGSVLIKINEDEVRNNLISQRSNLFNQITQAMPDLKMDYPDAFPKWEKYLQDFDIRSDIKALPAPSSEREKYFISARNFYNLYYAIKSLEERLSKYIITAPFSGVVTESAINPGTLIRVGQKLGEFIDPFSFELETAVSVSDIPFLKKGDKVILTSNDIGGEWTGTIIRINGKIETATQTVKIFVSVQGEQLKEGMFLKGKIKTGNISNAFPLSRNLVREDQKLFIVKDSILALRTVDVVRFSGDTAIVRGIPDGTKILKEAFPGAYEGMPVKSAN